jgi:hypothetical protein
MNTFVFTAGGDFDFSGSVTVSENGVALTDMTGWTGYCGVRTAAGVMVAEPTFTWLDASQRLCRVYSAAAATDLWPAGVLELNLLFVGPANQRIASPVTQFILTKGPANANP